MSIKVLHISDLHQRSEPSPGNASVLRAFHEDLAKLGDYSFDLVLMTGDLTQAGKPEQFEAARSALLSPLEESLSLSKDRFVVVPGNHDVDRNLISDRYEAGLRSVLLGPEAVDALIDDEVDLRESVKRLASWHSFADVHYGPDIGWEAPRKPVVLEYEINGASCCVVALDTAWRCSGDEDKGRLLLGASQLDAAKESLSAASVRIIALHHSPDWLAPWEEERFRDFVEECRAIVLHGHNHRARPLSRQTGVGHSIQLQAGCLYESSEYSNGYSVVQIDPSSELVRVQSRAWVPNRRQFDVDVSAGESGEVSFELPRDAKSVDRGHPPLSTVVGSLVEIANRLRVVPQDVVGSELATPRVSDLLIDPIFLNTPYKEAQALANMEKGISENEVDPVALLAERTPLIICGEDQGGISSSLLWILNEFYEENREWLPIYATAADLRFGTSKEAASLQLAASSMGYPAGAAKEKPLIFAIDDVEKLSAKRLKRLCEFFASHPQHLLVAGCKEGHVSDTRSAFTSEGVNHNHCYLAHLGRTQLRELASRHNLASDEGVDEIFDIMNRQKLPRTPFTMVALLSVARLGEVEVALLNESGVLQAFVNVLLGGSEVLDAENLGMDYRKREHLLGELAKRFDESGGETLPASDVERFILDYFEKLGLPNPAGPVLGSLVDRGVLINRQNEIAFRHPAFKDLFLAYWMRESDARRDELLRDCRRFSGAIRLTAGLKRTDEQLLRAVGEYCRLTIATHAPNVFPEDVDRIVDTLQAFGIISEGSLDAALGALPKPQTKRQRDEAVDRFVHLGSPGESIEAIEESDAFDSLKEIGEAVQLLSAVLRVSELIDDQALKRDMLWSALQGHIVLIGLLVADDLNDESVKKQLSGAIANLTEEEFTEEDAEVLDFLVLFLLLFVGVASAVSGLSSPSVAAPLADLTSREGFVDGSSVSWLATIVALNIELDTAPVLLRELLNELEEDSLKREVATLIGITTYQASSEKVAKGLIDVVTSEVASQTGQLAGKSTKVLREVRRSIENARADYKAGPKQLSSP